MLADVLTKPLHGSLFKQPQAVLLGHAHISTLKESPSATFQEEYKCLYVGRKDFGQTING